MQRLSRAPWRSIAFNVSILLFVVCCSASSVVGQTRSCSGDFSETCSDVGLAAGGYILEASCGDGRGSIQMSSLDLDEHITNSNGMLECSAGGGGFSASCESATASSSRLSAYCLDISGNLVFTTLDLNQCVENSFGTLTWACF